MASFFALMRVAFFAIAKEGKVKQALEMKLKFNGFNIVVWQRRSGVGVN